PLSEGVYILAGQSMNKYCEFIVDEVQEFTFSCDFHDITGTLEFSGSEINNLFYRHIRIQAEVVPRMERLRSVLSRVRQQDSISMINDSIALLDQQSKGFKEYIAGKVPGSLLYSMLFAMTEVEIPHTLEGKAAYHYYRDHYWDHFDLCDDRLVRTPIFHKKLEKFFSNVIVQHPDTLKSEADWLISQMNPSGDLFKFTVWYLTFKYETSRIMGFDEIFVHMVDRYYATGKAFWADSLTIRNIIKRADELRPVLLGNKAPELILMDTSRQFISLHGLEAEYTLVLFYECDCGHCRKEIGELKEWYLDNHHGLEVYAVCTDTSMADWKSLIIQQDLKWLNVNATRSITPAYFRLYPIPATPALFLLNRDKEIIAKRLRTEQLRPFLDEYVSGRKKEAGEN
ncbi:MAG: DUF5106 domain-containing protein, partial [Bacteroidales bacterium]|nr:DUF5106 domain-containing protein [Bacteroidales bacterium]